MSDPERLAEQVDDEWREKITKLIAEFEAEADRAEQGPHAANAWSEAAGRLLRITLAFAETEGQMKQYDEFTAVYQPKRTDDLKPEAVPFIGYRLAWQAVWRIEAEDSDEYAGQWACMVKSTEPRFAWVPECDLTDIEFTG